MTPHADLLALTRHFLACALFVACAGALSLACSSTDLAEPGKTEPGEGAGGKNSESNLGGEGATTSLKTVSGNEVTSESLRCLYGQSTGASDELSLQLQYLETPDSVAFAVSLTNPTPSAPFEFAAGQGGELDFEIFADDVRYESSPENGEITVKLDALPEPGSLSDGDSVVLRGSFKFVEYSVPEVSNLGDVGPRTLDLAAGSVDINCTATFQLSQVVD